MLLLELILKIPARVYVCAWGGAGLPDLEYTSRNSLHLTLNSVVRRFHTLNNVIKIQHLLQMLGEELQKKGFLKVPWQLDVGTNISLWKRLKQTGLGCFGFVFFFSTMPYSKSCKSVLGAVYGSTQIEFLLQLLFLCWQRTVRSYKWKYYAAFARRSATGSGPVRSFSSVGPSPLKVPAAFTNECAEP